jgi:hypothetical protein
MNKSNHNINSKDSLPFAAQYINSNPEESITNKIVSLFFTDARLHFTETSLNRM